MNIETTDADFETAFARHFSGGSAAWQELKTRARQCATDRLLATNSARRMEICELLPKRTGEPWMALQAEFERLMAEHEELVRAAAGESGTT
jgi:hypothetical protein